MRIRCVDARWALALGSLCSACAAGGVARGAGSHDGPVVSLTQLKRDVASSVVAVGELTRLESNIAQANLERDRSFFDRLTADEFVFTSESGTMTSRAENIAARTRLLSYTLDSYFIDELTARGYALDIYLIDDLTVKVHGDVGFVWGRVTINAHSTKEVLHKQLRFTHVFQRWAGQWHISMGHESGVPAQRSGEREAARIGTQSVRHPGCQEGA